MLFVMELREKEMIKLGFELAYYGLNPNIKVIAPWREWDLNSRKIN